MPIKLPRNEQSLKILLLDKLFLVEEQWYKEKQRDSSGKKNGNSSCIYQYQMHVTWDETVIYFPTGVCFPTGKQPFVFTQKGRAQVKIRKKKIQSTAEINFKYMNNIGKNAIARLL